MKKALSSFCIGTLVLLACNDSATNPRDEASSQPTEETASAATGGAAPGAQPTAAPPLVLASYSGTLPCADCEGIEVTLTLLSDSSFHKRNLYMGRKAEGPGSNEFNDTGKYVMKGDTMVLNDVKDAPNKYLKTDSGLVQLDLEGKRIRSKMANKYVLRKAY